MMADRSLQAAFVILVSILALAASLPADAQSGRMGRVFYGVVVSSEPIQIQTAPGNRKAATGATVGAIAGAALADRGDGLLGSLIGGAIGGAIGRSADRRRAKAIRGTELIIRLQNGEEVMVETTSSAEYYPGDRVQVINSSRGTRVKRVR